MIGKLTGKIDRIDTGYALIDVNGVGYIVFASARTLGRIGGAGNNTSLLIETHVREDHIHLYGFCDALEQQWFNLLTKVQGVGAKVGLAILSVASPNDLALAIAAQDKAVFSRADGVGPKLATRIVTELKDKAGAIDLSVGAGGGGMRGEAALPHKNMAENENGDMGEALSALVNLGYGRSEAMVALSTANKDADLPSLIKHGLKELAA